MSLSPNSCTRVFAQAVLCVAGALALGLGGGGCAASGSAARREFDLGFLASRDRDLEGNVRTRALGPLYERRTRDDGGQFTAVRPLYARSANPERDRVLSEFLWPVGMHKTLGKETYWRFLLAYGNDFDNTTPGSRYRFVVFPLLFTGRDRHGDGYFALFPFGGTLREYLGRDRIVFVLFPLYSFSAINDQRRHDVLWPMGSWAESSDLSHIGFRPFYARTVKEGRWEKRTIAWPFWTEARYLYPGAEGHVRMLWPLFWRGNLENEKTWMFLPPLFRFTRADRQTTVHAPWPLVQYGSGLTDKLYLWPVWGRKTIWNTDSWFLFWPLLSGGRLPRAGGEVRHFNLMPFVQYRHATRPASVNAGETEQTPENGTSEPEPTVTERRFKLWPLFSWQRAGSASRLRMLELWPGKDLPQLERSWAPFWTLYTRERLGPVKEDEALWGLFRYRRDEDSARKLSLFPLFHYARETEPESSRSWSVLLGLIGHRRDESRRTLRLLYIPIRYRR